MKDVLEITQVHAFLFLVLKQTVLTIVGNIMSVTHSVCQQCKFKWTKNLGLEGREPVLGGGVGADNTGADQLAHLRRLISAFVVRLFESIISKLTTSEISIF